jgi:L-ascorbate metabolism protein UlaG (beta-lactamase superfamily)
MSSPPGQSSAAPSHRIGPEVFRARPGTTVRWLTNAGFLINARGTLLVLDPAISLDPESPGRSETGMRLLVSLPIEADRIPRLEAVLYTHADDDHFAPATARALSRTDAIFVGPPPVVSALKEMGLPEDRLRVARIGGDLDVGRTTIVPTPADHPWQLRDPKRFGDPWKPGDCCGYAMDTPDGRIWCPGDTRLMDDHVLMKGVDLLLLDVSRCDYHLGVDNAARLANILDPPSIIPYHWGTYDAPDSAAYNGDPEEVRGKLHRPKAYRVLAPGEEFRL